MGAGDVHPSQKRVSCEVCRKHKSRCRRLHSNDLRCARCMLLDVECTAGLQSKVGRPRRALASVGEASRQPSNKAVSRVNTNCAPPAAGEHNRTKTSPGRPHAASPCLDGGEQLDWSSSMPPAVTREPILVTPANGSLDMEPAWPNMGIDFLGQASLPWDMTNDLDHMFSSLDTDSNFNFTILPSHALDTPTSSSSPPDRIYPGAIETRAPSRQGCTAGDVTVASDALVKLSKLNLDLHIRMAAVEMNKSILDFDSFIYQNGVLHIDGTTVAEFLLKTSQEFLQILTQLRSSRSTPTHLSALRTTDTMLPKLSSQSLSPYHDNHYMPPSPSPSPSGSSDVSERSLSAPIALTITSIFIQLISLYEVLLEHLTARIERIAIDPIKPMPNLSSGGLPVVDACIQGMLFSEVAVHLLERIERLLGIGAALPSGDGSFLSARQRDVLWSELGGSLNVLPSHGAMRPTNVRNMFKKVAVTLKQISIDEQNW